MYDPNTYVNLLCLKIISNGSVKSLSFKKPWDVGRILEILNSTKLFVGFNLKFDMSWLRREFGFVPTFGTRFHDCQYAEFLFSSQTWRFPDLRTACAKRGLSPKQDHIKENYWDKGIDTCDIPMDELEEYCVNDVEITYQLFIEQQKLFSNEHASMLKLFKLHMLDLPVLLEMEWNGLKYNKAESLRISEENDTKIQYLETQLNNMIDFKLNWNSNNEKSAILYGGTVSRTIQVPIGHYKSGARVGQVKYKNVESLTEFPQLVKPLEGQRGSDEPNTSVAEDVLRSLKPTKYARKIIDLILERAKLEKLNGTYLKGLPKKMETYEWGDYLHPSYNQCTAVTGRIASSNPNGQNLPGQAKQLVRSRWT